MTKTEYTHAYRGFERQLTWRVVLFMVPWLAIFLGVGIGFRDWFRHRDAMSLLFMGAMIALLLVSMYFITLRLRERWGLICPRCGLRAPQLWVGLCLKCRSFIYDDE